MAPDTIQTGMGHANSDSRRRTTEECTDARCWRQCNARRSRAHVLWPCPSPKGRRRAAHRARSHLFTCDSARGSATALVGVRSRCDPSARRTSGKARRQRPCGIVRARGNRTDVLTPFLPDTYRHSSCTPRTETNRFPRGGAGLRKTQRPAGDPGAIGSLSTAAWQGSLILAAPEAYVAAMVATCELPRRA